MPKKDKLTTMSPALRTAMSLASCGRSARTPLIFSARHWGVT
jgi:hypothetical protein